MSKAMEEFIKVELQYEKIEIAKRMLADGKLSVEKIAYYLGMSIDEVKDLSELQNPPKPSKPPV